MLQLYFCPMACSLASRIALMEAGIEARYRLVNIWTKKLTEDDSDFCAVSSKGAVPVLELANGERLTESAAVLQYIADLKPDTATKSRSLSPAGMAEFYGQRDPQGVSVPDLLVQGRCSKGRGARADQQKPVDRRRSFEPPRPPGRRPLHRRRRPSRLGAAVASTRRARCRQLAVAGRLSRADAGSSAGQGGDRDGDCVVQDAGGLTGRPTPPAPRPRACGCPGCDRR